jgi:serine protein kinase
MDDRIGVAVLIYPEGVWYGQVTAEDVPEIIERHIEKGEVVEPCPMHEEPLHLIPKAQRPKWEEVLGIKIEGELCPMCRFNLLGTDAYKDKNGNVLWERFPVVRIRLDERGRRGIGTFQPADPKNQDIAELIGRVDLSKITQYGETDPRAYSLDGELEIANRGLMEYVEI